MSTNWGYYCRTCREASPHWLNHGDTVLVWLFRNRNEILPCWRLSQGITGSKEGGGWLEGPSVLGAYDDPQPLPFLHQHGQHDLELQNEYGRNEPFPLLVESPPWKPEPYSEPGT